MSMPTSVPKTCLQADDPQGTLVVPLLSPSEGRRWFTEAQNRYDRDQCWCCSTVFPGRDENAWVEHRPVGPRAMAQSCCRRTAELYQTIYDYALKAR